MIVQTWIAVIIVLAAAAWLLYRPFRRARSAAPACAGCPAASQRPTPPANGLVTIQTKSGGSS
jgi:hypothetical protein